MKELQLADAPDGIQTLAIVNIASGRRFNLRSIS